MQLILNSAGSYGMIATVISIIMAGAGLIVAFNHYVAKHIFFLLIEKTIGKKRAGLTKIILDNRLLHRIAYLVPAILLFYFSDFFNFRSQNFVLLLADLVKMVSEIYILFDLALIFLAFLNCFHDRYNQYPIGKLRPIKSYLQLIKIGIVSITLIIAASLIFNKPPIYFFTGVGATTAFFALVFKDMVMGFIASVQLTAYDMVRLGDWIEMPNFGADGEVMEISLSTVKVQNFDKTIVTIPSYALLSTGLKNWRGMHESGGRRVKRSINIDINSIKITPANFIEDKKDLSKFIEEKANQTTNIGWFRIYLQAYLRQHQGVHKGMRIQIRQLQGTTTGLPLELYFFTNVTDSQKYEAIQADIIEHVYAIMPRFDLRAYQSASAE